MREKGLYTTGEIAKMAGVTVRTIRYYDTKGVLVPSHYNSSGHRLYSYTDFYKLKQVLALKYLGLSLDEIIKIDLNLEKKDIIDSLRIQKNIVKNKINHMKVVLNTIETAQNSIENDNNLDINKTINIIKILESEKELLQQYIDVSNLDANIKLQDRFGCNEIGWYNWVFDNLNIKEGNNILEIGCGNGVLWSKNIKRLNKSVKINLTDICEDMIKGSKVSLQQYTGQFKFNLIDPSNLLFEDESFDIVIANHILFYMKDLNKILHEIHRVLKPGGYFYCSTINNEHMKELEDLLLGFNSNITIPEKRLCTKFGEMNGESILNKYFKNVSRKVYSDELVINDPKGILEYVYSMPGNILEIVDNKKKEFEKYINKNINHNKPIHITNSHCLFQSIKNNKNEPNLEVQSNY